jgi:hypothetical protein
MRPLTLSVRPNGEFLKVAASAFFLLAISTALLLTSGEAVAKPKAPRTGMHDCTVGELEAIRNQIDQNFIDHCAIDGGTMYCDNQGFSCCKTSANGVEVCNGQDWGGKPAPKKTLPSTPVKPDTRKSR